MKPDVIIQYECTICGEKWLLGIKDKPDFRFYLVCPVCGSEEVIGTGITRTNGNEDEETNLN